MREEGSKWFSKAGYGLFIHWGLYSILAGEYEGVRTSGLSEWIMNDLEIPAAEYEKLAAKFDPVEFDAMDVVRRAKEWGMRYIVFTSKHHEGFAMFHSKCSGYNVVDAAPCKRDILKELQLACEKYDMPLGLYYSQAQDWHHPGGLFGYRENSYDNYQEYLDEKAFPQLKEILTEYGKIALIWFDTPLGTTVEQSEAMVQLVKDLQKDCVVSGRIGNHLGDYMTTGDNFIPRLPFDGDWEAPATLNDTWGYSSFDHNWKSPEDVIRLLIKINSCGGNLLLNIGPDALGRIPQESVDVLDKVGEYVRKNSEAIYDTVGMPLYPYMLTFGEMTCKPGRLYVHIFSRIPRLEILNVLNTVKRARILEPGQELKVHTGRTCEGDGFIRADIPEEYQNRAFYCIEIEIGEDEPLFHPINR